MKYGGPHGAPHFERFPVYPHLSVPCNWGHGMNKCAQAYTHTHKWAVLGRKKGVKNGSETRFAKYDPGIFGMYKQVKCAH